MAESKKPKRGRKPADESRARVLRDRLIVWKQTPEPQRVSLRALAADLGTSHQLLAFYLRGLDKWQKKDYERRAEDIRSQATTENRLMTPWERSQVEDLERTAFHCMIESAAGDMLKRLEADAKAGRLTGVQLKVVKILAQQLGHAGSSKNTPKAPTSQSSHRRSNGAKREKVGCGAPDDRLREGSAPDTKTHAGGA